MNNKFKIVLAIQVFIAGFVVMTLEILGSRLLAPTFGSSIFVWGSLIGVFLLSMAIGYFIGGRLSLHNPSMIRLCFLVMAAAVIIMLIPYFYKPVCVRIDDLIPDERWGSLFATVAIFTLPLCLLGGVSPYAVRLASKSIESVGDAAGNLYAVSTIGSFLGTIITAFYLIPAFPTTRTVLATGAVTFAIFTLFVLISWVKQKSNLRQGRD